MIDISIPLNELTIEHYDNSPGPSELLQEWTVIKTPIKVKSDVGPTASADCSGSRFDEESVIAPHLPIIFNEGSYLYAFTELPTPDIYVVTMEVLTHSSGTLFNIFEYLSLGVGERDGIMLQGVVNEGLGSQPVLGAKVWVTMLVTPDFVRVFVNGSLEIHRDIVPSFVKVHRPKTVEFRIGPGLDGAFGFFFFQDLDTFLESPFGLQYDYDRLFGMQLALRSSPPPVPPELDAVYRSRPPRLYLPLDELPVEVRGPVPVTVHHAGLSVVQDAAIGPTLHFSKVSYVWMPEVTCPPSMTVIALVNFDEVALDEAQSTIMYFAGGEFMLSAAHGRIRLAHGPSLDTPAIGGSWQWIIMTMHGETKEVRLQLGGETKRGTYSGDLSGDGICIGLTFIGKIAHMQIWDEVIEESEITGACQRVLDEEAAS